MVRFNFIWVIVNVLILGSLGLLLIYQKQYNQNKYQSNYLFQNSEDFKIIVQALENFKVDSGHYPISNSWSGYFSFERVGGENWIPGLKNDYLESLPREPRSLTNTSQYLYKSDGVNFKLLNHDCPSSLPSGLPAPLNWDPIRRGFCIAVWSEGAKNW